MAAEEAVAEVVAVTMAAPMLRPTRNRLTVSLAMVNRFTDSNQCTAHHQVMGIPADTGIRSSHIHHRATDNLRMDRNRDIHHRAMDLNNNKADEAGAPWDRWLAVLWVVLELWAP